MNPAANLPRRAVLAGAVGLIGGCASGTGTTPPPTLPQPSSQQTPQRPAPTQSSPAATVEPAVLPSRDDILQRYSESTPLEWGTAVTGVVTTLADLPARTPRQERSVALTLDACGGGGAGDGFDAALIDLLRTHRVPATLYLNSRWIRAHAVLAAELAQDELFRVACHGSAHVPLSVTGRSAYGITGTASVGAAYDELTSNMTWFSEHLGRPQQSFRPGTAHCDEIGAAIARDLGMPVAGFSVNGDGGATFTAEMVERTLLEVTDGDIVLAHMNRPGGGTAQGCARAIPRLVQEGVTFVTIPAPA